MYLFFDTETTGLPRNWKAPVSDLNNWPRLVQLAYLVFDHVGNEISSGNHIIRPNNFIIPSNASQIHGISTERAKQVGEEISNVLQKFELLASQSQFLVAHNMNYDEKIISAEFLRYSMQNSISTTNKICTMESTVDFCEIKGLYGNKWPKLSELHLKLFNSDFSGAHNAFTDISITAKCFWELRRLGKI